MRSTLLATALLVLAPSLAVAAPGHDAHAGHGGSKPGGAVDQVIKANGMVATFHVDAPAKVAYTCAMHPEVTSAKPGTCSKCKMKLDQQTHRVSLKLVDAHQKPVRGAFVRLAIKDAHGMLQGLNVKGDGTYAGKFHLMPGTHQLTAFVKPKNHAKTLEFSMPLTVK